MIIKNGHVIHDLETWRQLAGPKRDVQWQDDRSAKESAKFWLRAAPSIPDEIRSPLESHEDFDQIQEWTAEPEASVLIDSFRGEPPNLDVLLVARDSSGPFVVAVEAKADETFGTTLRETASAAAERLESNPNSKGITRIERLVEALCGPQVDLESLKDYRYQLFTAAGAALAEAERRSAARAVLMVHEFVTSRTADSLLQRNGEDLNAYVEMLSAGTTLSLDAGELVGPFQLLGYPLVKRVASFYVGKAVRNLRRAPGRTSAW